MADQSETTTPHAREWPARVRTMPNGDVCITLGDREHVLSAVQSVMLRCMLDAANQGLCQDTGEVRMTPSRRISDAGRGAWDAWLAAEKRLAEIDQQRRAALDEKDRLHCEMMRIGRQEGWHA
jgi:hypothetical protein